jgi:hypothetical protein
VPMPERKSERFSFALKAGRGGLMGKVINMEEAINKELSFAPGFKTFSFEFKKAMAKAFCLMKGGMSPKRAAIESGFENVWVKEGHGKARKKKGGGHD